MNYILLTLVTFLYLITYLILFDIILSWLILFGINFRPAFIANIIDPMYTYVRKYIPTSIGPLDFTPFIIIIFIKIILGFIPVEIINIFIK